MNPLTVSTPLQQRLRVEIELYRELVSLVVLPPPCPLTVQPIGFSRAAELIERSLGDSREYLDLLARDGARESTESVAPVLQHSHP